MKKTTLVLIPLLFSLFVSVVIPNATHAAPPERGTDLQPTQTSDPSQPTQTSDPSQPTQTSDPSSPSSDVTGGSNANANIKLFDPIDKSIEEIFQAILDIIMVFAIPIVLFFIVWAGFLYVTARGDTSQLEKAHKALLYAVLGGIIVVGAQALLYVITNTIALFGN